MTFFINSLSSKKYFSLLKLKYSKKFFLENYGMFLGNKSFYRQAKINEIIQKTKEVKGDVVEFGIWNGNNLFIIKKYVDYYKLKKKVFGFDNFSGFPNPTKLKNKKKGKYIGKPELINKIIKFFRLKKIQIINDDINNLDNHSKKFKKLSFVYVDCNIYGVVKKILLEVNNKLSKGGIIAFDEAQHPDQKGEGKAMMEFYNSNKKSYRLIKLNKNYQPDAILIKKN